jgi:predicted thioesterase
MSSAAENLPLAESTMPPLVGVLGFATMTVRPGDTLAAQGVGDLTVVSNANLISLLESAAIAALDEYCGTGISTILNSMTLEAATSAAIGAELQASAECIGQEGELNNVLTFSCEIYEGERLVLKAIQKRSTVERVTFLARTAAQKLFESK